MADVAKQIEEHLKRRYNRAPGEPSFANCLTAFDKFEAHGMGVLIEELMSTAEMIEYRRSKAVSTPDEDVPCSTASCPSPLSRTRAN